MLHVCLLAPLPVVQERLKARADARGEALSPWSLRRADECGAAHQASEFALHVQTAFRDPVPWLPTSRL